MSFTAVHEGVPAPKPKAERSVAWYFGPAFVASVAYIDPGNFATNIEGGSRFGYSLLWVLLWSNLMAVLIQSLSAKLGIATGRTLTQNIRAQFSPRWNIGLWIAAEISALATDLAEFLGAALGFYLLFHIPMFPAGLLTGAVVFGILAFEKLGFRRLEHAIMFFVAVIGVCYAVELAWARPAWGPVVKGVLLPIAGTDSIYIAVGMLGATVMPHVVYLHSALVQHRNEEDPVSRRRHQRMQIIDVLLAMNGAWLVNSAMVIMAAAVFYGAATNVVSIEQAHQTLRPLLGPASATLFAVALLCSGLSSSAVGTMAGQVIIEGFLDIKFSIFLRRFITMVPALIVIGVGFDPSKALVLSQVFLSFGIPFALVPLLFFTSSRKLMGELVNRRLVVAAAGVVTALIIGLNVYLLASA